MSWWYYRAIAFTRGISLEGALPDRDRAYIRQPGARTYVLPKIGCLARMK